MPSREPTTAAPADAYLRPGRFIDSDLDFLVVVIWLLLLVLAIVLKYGSQLFG